MNSETRLLDGEGTATERLLLESSRDDGPSHEARARTLVALGLSASAAVLAPSAVHAATNLASGSVAGKTGSSITVLLIAKWLGAGAAVGAVTAACIATATTPGILFSRAPERAPQAAPVKATAPAPVAAAAAAPSRAEEPAAAGATAAGKAAPSVALRAPHGDEPQTEPTEAPPASPGTGTVSSLAAEVASLDRARTALASGDARTALARLSEHERRFPGGALEPEAAVLRVRALRDAGDGAAAMALARKFLAAHPDSSQASRIRALVGLPPQ